MRAGRASLDARCPADDLAAVRAAMQAACPCATFDGGPGRGPRAYRRCTRPVVHGALAKVLPRPCRRLLRRSTCGRPDRVVCCQERLASGTRTCRVRRPARCAPTRRAIRTALNVESCADTDCLPLAPPSTTTTTTLLTVTTVTTTSTSTTTLPPSFAAFHAAVIGPRCGFCHGLGGEGGLEGLSACATAHVHLVDVPSTALPGRDRVEPGAPTLSWLVQKLDGTQGAFDDECAGGTCGDSMPLGEPLLDAEVRTAIRTWIATGAANDCP